MSLRCGFTTAFAFLAAVFSGALAQGKGNCSNASLNGSYGVTATGTAIGVGPVALVGVFNYDGQGNFTGIIYQKVNGNNVQLTFTGTYNVDSSCVVSDTVYLSNKQIATHASVVVDWGNEFYILNTTAPTATSGNVVIGTGKKLFTERGN
jgi:hypothetical protein